MTAVVTPRTFLNPNSRSTPLFLRTPRCLPSFPRSVYPGRNRVSHSVLKDRKGVVSEEDGHSKGEELPNLVIEYEEKGGNDGFDKVVGRGINAAIVLGIGSLAVTRLLTIDHEYWHKRTACTHAFGTLTRETETDKTRCSWSWHECVISAWNVIPPSVTGTAAGATAIAAAATAILRECGMVVSELWWQNDTSYPRYKDAAGVVWFDEPLGLLFVSILEVGRGRRDLTSGERSFLEVGRGRRDLTSGERSSCYSKAGLQKPEAALGMRESM